MQQKGERENMTNGECCRYIRTYSELEGLQHACGAGAVAGGAGGCTPALPAAGYFEKRNKYSRRTGFLWHLSVLRAQTSAILRN